jgi:serine/threonine-protein kinase
MKTSWALAIAAFVVLAGGNSARAQTSTAENERAERLFQEGKNLMGEKRYEEACPKLQESQRIDPATGTLLALALCHEGQGKLATAWREFRQALPLAQGEKRRDRESLAQSHVNELTPRLPKLVVSVPRDVAQNAGFAIRIDGERLDAGSYNMSTPLDPGDHVIEAVSDGKTSWRGSVSLVERETKTLLIPGSSPARTDEHHTDTDRTPSGGLPLREIGIALVSVGGVALITGSIFGLSAISKNSDATDKCPNPNACADPEALKLNDESRSAATASTILIIGGVVFAAGGAALILTSPSKRAAAGPVVGPGFVGFSGRAVF